MTRHTLPIIRVTVSLLVVLLVAACAEGPTPIEPALDVLPQASTRAELVCVDVNLTGTAALGIIPAGFEGAGGLGALPAPTTIGGIDGTLHSYVTSPITPVGANAQGAAHITLRHVFTAAGGSFFTDDRANCGPIPGGPGTCRLSDQLTIAGGTGVFNEAAGKLHNRGVLDFNTFTLAFHATGKVCGAGL